MTVTLETCDREPIHVPGAVQPHGVLLACDPTSLAVRFVSNNVADHLDLTTEAVRQSTLLDLLDAPSAEFVKTVAQAPGVREHNPIHVCSKTGRGFDLVLHHTVAGERLLVAELEPGVSDTHGPAIDRRLRTSVIRLQSARDLPTLFRVAAAEVREITGFDRVMVYRFDADWNGEVVAEERHGELQPFLGQHYPASDIPAQARRLYTLNPLRFIADVAYRPSAIVPDAHAQSAAPLDLSHAVLRSVSPIHVEYLQNMGVRASMSMSLIVDGQLAGLLACHHYAGPRLVSFRVRDTCEHLAHTLAWQLRVLESADRAHLVQQTQAHETAIVRSLAMCTDVFDGVTVPSLLRLTAASGAAVVAEGRMRTIGTTPNEEDILTITRWLAQQGETVVATDHLASQMPGAEAFAQSAAGLVAVPVSRELGEYILWFRPSRERTIDWAGDPNKVAVLASDGTAPRLSPRGSFELWREVVRGRSDPWLSHEVEAAGNLRAILLSGVRNRLHKERSLNASLAEADRAKDNFIATVSHELRTPLNAIAGWAQLLMSGDVPADRQRHAVGVIARNASAQAAIVDDLLDVSRMTQGTLAINVGPVDLIGLVDAAIEATALAARAKQITIARSFDDNVPTVDGDAARIRQIVVNLLANASKFTDKGGRISVSLRGDGTDVEIAVTDNGRGIDPSFLPYVFEPFRQEDSGTSRQVGGIGLGLAIARKLAELHGGTLVAESKGLGQGACFTLRLPVSPVSRNPKHPPAVDDGASPVLHGLDVLVVEDDVDARELIAFVLSSRGARVTEADGALEALAILEQRRFDAIVSDIGMPQMDGRELVRTLRAREDKKGQHTLAIAVSAFSRATDREAAITSGFDAHLPKPVDVKELTNLLAGLTGRLSS